LILTGIPKSAQPNLQYPKGAGVLRTFLQRWVAKLDEFGSNSCKGRLDLACKEDKCARAFQKAFDDYGKKVFGLTKGGKEFAA